MADHLLDVVADLSAQLTVALLREDLFVASVEALGTLSTGQVVSEHGLIDLADGLEADEDVAGVRVSAQLSDVDSDEFG